MRKEKGFTLVELMLVIAIIGIIAGVVVAKMAVLTDKSKEEATAGKVSGLKSAINIYYGTHGRWPGIDLQKDLCTTYIQRIPPVTVPGEEPTIEVVYVGDENMLGPSFDLRKVQGGNNGEWLYDPRTGDLSVNSEEEHSRSKKGEKDFIVKYDIGHGDGRSGPDGKVQYWEYYLR